MNRDLDVKEHRLRKLQEERLKRMKMELYKVDPMRWLKERFGEDTASYEWSTRPEYANHTWDGDQDPLSNAWNALALNHWVGVQAATGTSKTHTLSRIVFWFLDCFEDALVVTSAPKQDQLKLHLWAEIGKSFKKFKKLRPYAKLNNLQLIVDSRNANISEDADDESNSNAWQAVGFVAGSGSDEQSATKAQGFHRKHMLIIMEECPGMSEAVMTAFQNTSTGGHNLIIAVGNPDNELDPLNEFCNLEHVKKFRISAFDYPNVVLGDEVLAGAVTRASIERRKNQYGENSSLYQSRVRGICPTEGSDSLIKLSWIKQCINTPEHEVKPEVLSYYNGMGVDVAASDAGDKGCTASGVRGILTKLKEFRCPNATHLGYNLIYEPHTLEAFGYEVYNIPTIQQMNVSPELVGIDTVGVGVATIECLKDQGYSCVPLAGAPWKEAIPKGEAKDGKAGEPLYAFSSLRAQMYWEAREDLRREFVKIDTTDIEPEVLKQLMRELTAPKVDLKSGKISVESKESIKKRSGGKSPNLADAFVYWNWSRKGYKLDPFAGMLTISAGD